MSAHRYAALAGLVCAMCLASAPAHAAGARQGVHPDHGEMVLLRDVSARHGYRPQPPGIAVIADPRPTGEIANALGTGELSDADFAALASGNRYQPGAQPQTTVGAIVGQTLGTGPGAGSGPAGAASGGFSGALSGPLGTVGTTTRGIGDQVKGALAQFPFGQGNGTGP